MPYASQAQARKFHADPKLRKLAPEWDAATNFSKLPKRARRKKRHGHSKVAAGLMQR